MARLRTRHLPHCINIERLAGEGAEGVTYDEPDILVPAYIEMKSKLVVDRRSTSDTAGQEVAASTFVVVHLVDDTLPGARVTVWQGTPRERTSEVITSEYFDYKGTPSHVELWLE